MGDEDEDEDENERKDEWGVYIKNGGAGITGLSLRLTPYIAIYSHIQPYINESSTVIL